MFSPTAATVIAGVAERARGGGGNDDEKTGGGGNVTIVDFGMADALPAPMPVAPKLAASGLINVGGGGREDSPSPPDGGSGGGGGGGGGGGIGPLLVATRGGCDSNFGGGGKEDFFGLPPPDSAFAAEPLIYCRIAWDEDARRRRCQVESI